MSAKSSLITARLLALVLAATAVVSPGLAVGSSPPPVVVLHGSEDVIPVSAAAEWTTAFPNSRLLLLEGVGHFPYVEAPEAFFPAIDSFLGGKWPEGAQSPGS